MNNPYIELSKIEKEIGFDELQKNILEQRDIFLMILLSSYVNLKVEAGMTIYRILQDVLGGKNE